MRGPLMKTLYRFGLPLLLAVTSLSSLSSWCQQPSPNTVAVSEKSTTVRIADPNELVNVNGRVMRVADYVAVLSSSTLWGQHLRIPEKQTPSDSPQAPPAEKTHSKSPAA